MIDRRQLLGVLAAGLGAAAAPRVAQATVIRGLSLEELTRESERILLGRALEATSHWVTFAGRKRIVTDTRWRVDDAVAKERPRDSEVMIRTLGGRVGDVGAIVHGEAELALEEPCVLFLRALPDGLHRVSGMSQGHYPLRADTQRIVRLQPSPRANEVLVNDRTALRRLVGRELPEARDLIRKALAR